MQKYTHLQASLELDTSKCFGKQGKDKINRVCISVRFLHLSLNLSQNADSIALPDSVQVRRSLACPQYVKAPPQEYFGNSEADEGKSDG
jgi:hypothetical protein